MRIETQEKIIIQTIIVYYKENKKLIIYLWQNHIFRWKFKQSPHICSLGSVEAPLLQEQAEQLLYFYFLLSILIFNNLIPFVSSGELAMAN